MSANARMQDLFQSHLHTVVGYLTAGYPDRESFFRIVKTCEERGLSVLEIGFPSKNPQADGEVIRRAHAQVDPAIATDLDFWRKLRQTVSIPIWVMGYEADLSEDGMYRKLAEEGIADAYVIPDASFDRQLHIKSELLPYKTEMVPLVSADMDSRQIDRTLRSFPLIYQQLYQGVTGMNVAGDGYKALLQYNLKHGDNRLFAGFGISTVERVQELFANGFYGAVIGTEILRKLNESEEKLYAFIEELHTAEIASAERTQESPGSQSGRNCTRRNG